MGGRKSATGEELPAAVDARKIPERCGRGGRGPTCGVADERLEGASKRAHGECNLWRSQPLPSSLLVLALLFWKRVASA